MQKTKTILLPTNLKKYLSSGEKMPTYEYECSACGHQMEVLQSMMEKRLTKCPACHKNKLERLIGGGTGIIFKGSGFYETDYKKKDAPKGSGGKAPAKAPCSNSCACHPPSAPRKS